MFLETKERCAPTLVMFCLDSWLTNMDSVLHLEPHLLISTLLNVMDLFPEGFQPRCPVSSVLFVSPIPGGLEERLVPRPDVTSDAWTSDLRNILGYEHLGYLMPDLWDPMEHPLR
jgi:hypothetical protein